MKQHPFESVRWLAYGLLIWAAIIVTTIIFWIL